MVNEVPVTSTRPVPNEARILLVSQFGRKSDEYSFTGFSLRMK